MISGLRAARVAPCTARIGKGAMSFVALHWLCRASGKANKVRQAHGRQQVTTHWLSAGEDLCNVEVLRD